MFCVGWTNSLRAARADSAIASEPTEILRGHPHAPLRSELLQRGIRYAGGADGLARPRGRRSDRSCVAAPGPRRVGGRSTAGNPWHCRGPASGKSTVARLLLAELDRCRPGAAVGVGMDAFHIGH